MKPSFDFGLCSFCRSNSGRVTASIVEAAHSSSDWCEPRHWVHLMAAAGLGGILGGLSCGAVAIACSPHASVGSAHLVGGFAVETVAVMVGVCGGSVLASSVAVASASNDDRLPRMEEEEREHRLCCWRNRRSHLPRAAAVEMEPLENIPGSWTSSGGGAPGSMTITRPQLEVIKQYGSLN